MTSPLLLLHRGAGGLTPVEPVAFDGLELPASPNTCLVGPASYAGPKHLTHAPWAVTPAVLWATLNRLAAGFPRTWKLGEFPDLDARPIQPSAPGGAPAIGRADGRPIQPSAPGGAPAIGRADGRPIQPSAPGGAPAIGRAQAQWVERSALMNYPDIIAAEVRPAPEGAALLLYSRSLFGWSDLGVNKARAERWLAALDAALR
jgi:hypothetical protein